MNDSRVTTPLIDERKRCIEGVIGLGRKNFKIEKDVRKTVAP